MILIFLFFTIWKWPIWVCFQRHEAARFDSFLVCNYTEHFGRDPWDEIPTTIPEITTPETTIALTPSPCDDKNTFRCPENSICIPTDNQIGYSCECLDGYKMSGNYCQKLQSEVSDPDCSSNFKDWGCSSKKRLMKFYIETP